MIETSHELRLQEQSDSTARFTIFMATKIQVVVFWVFLPCNDHYMASESRRPRHEVIQYVKKVEAELKVIQNSYRLDSRCKAFIYMKQSS